MVQLPVFRTFRHALGFVLWNGFTIFRLTWLPLALFVAVVNAPLFIFDWESTKAIYGFPNNGVVRIDEQIVAMAMVIQLFTMVLQAIAITSVAVAVHRIILFNDRSPGHYFRFAFGKTEFAFLAMTILSLLIGVGIIGSILGPVAYLVTGGDFLSFFQRLQDMPKEGGELGMRMMPLMGAYFVAWIVVLFVFVRLAVWPPSVVATNSVSPAEAWSLSRGNFWRFIGLFMLAGLAMYAVILALIAGFYVYYSQHAFSFETWQATRDMPPEDALWRIAGPYLPTLVAFHFFMMMFATAFVVAIVSFAYKALKGVEADAAVDGA